MTSLCLYLEFLMRLVFWLIWEQWEGCVEKEFKTVKIDKHRSSSASKEKLHIRVARWVQCTCEPTDSLVSFCTTEHVQRLVGFNALANPTTPWKDTLIQNTSSDSLERKNYITHLATCWIQHTCNPNDSMRIVTNPAIQP